jgi:glycosyltransferase involved in cell wall biosynthesis
VKLAFVVQRYGAMVVGGAESYCRQLSEELAARGHDVHVYTTAAVDERTWANALPTGPSVEKNVHIHRFKTVMPRVAFVSGLTLRVFWTLNGLSRLFGLESNPLIISFVAWLESIFFILQGPWTPSLLKSLSDDQERFDAVCFVTYLFYPTIFGLRRINRPKFLIPTAHDEKAFYLASVSRLLMESSGILALSKAESELIISRLPSVKSKIQILGYGLKLPDVNNELSSDVQSKLPAGDFLLFLGRISPGKGVETLLDYVERMWAQGMSDFSLVLAGVRQDIDIPSAKHVVYLGKVSEADKFALIKKSLAVVNPSSHESLSMVVIEAITCGIPVLVNSKSPVLHAYTETYETVFGFSDFQEFLQNVQKVRAWNIDTNSQEVRKKLSQSSANAKAQYSWDGVMTRFTSAVTTTFK